MLEIKHAIPMLRTSVNNENRLAIIKLDTSYYVHVRICHRTLSFTVAAEFALHIPTKQITYIHMQ